MFNPFRNNERKIDEISLQHLIEDEVSEGVFVEYKRELTENKKIAKSIASFANTKGGWYFIGIDADHTTNKPTAIVGLDSKSTPDPISSVREIAKSLIQPVPFISIELVTLSSGNFVVVVQIPPDQEKPFINRDGRIYRRQLDSSTPVSETDRYALDRMYEETKELHKQFRDFCTDRRSFLDIEQSNPWVSVYLSPIPAGEFFDEKMYFEPEVRMRELLEMSRTAGPVSPLLADTTGNTEFHRAVLTNRSICLSQCKDEHGAVNSLSLELFMDGRAVMHFPIQYLDLHTHLSIDTIETTEIRDMLIEYHLQNTSISMRQIRLLDIGHTLLPLVLISNYYKKWYASVSDNSEIRYALLFRNVGECMALVDSPEWVEQIREFGPPVIKRNSIEVPTGIQQGIKDSLTGELGLRIGIWIARTLGLNIDQASRSFASSLAKAAAHKPHWSQISY